MKVLLAWGMALLCLGAKAQNPNLQIDLPYFGANPAVNRQVTYQQTTPFLGNLVYGMSDSVTGMVVFPTVPSGVLNIVIQSPPGSKIAFQVNILPTDSGTVDATNRLSNSGPTYPAGLTSWAIATSDTRYALNTNQAGAYVGIGQLLTTSNALQSQISASGGTPILAGTNINIYQSGGSNVINASVSQLSVTLAQSNAMYSATNFTIGTSNILQGNINSSNSLTATIATNLTASASNSLSLYSTGVSNNVVSNQGYAVGVSNNVANNFAYSLSLSNFSLAISNSVISTNLANIASTNAANLATTTNLITTASNNLIANLIISNTANLTITTNLVNASTNVLIPAILTVINNSSNAAAANAQSALSATNTFTLSYILTNNPTFAGVTTSNFNNLVTTTNLVSSFSNNITTYALGISNITVNNQAFAATVSNSVATSSNTVAANAQSNLTATNAANLIITTNLISSVSNNLTTAYTAAINASSNQVVTAINTNVTWGITPSFTSDARKASLYLYVSNSIELGFLVTTN